MIAKKSEKKKIKAIFVHAEFWPNTIYLCDLQAQMRFDITRIVSYYSWSTNNSISRIFRVSFCLALLSFSTFHHRTLKSCLGMGYRGKTSTSQLFNDMEVYITLPFVSLWHCAAPSSSPQNVSIRALTSTSIAISWDPPDLDSQNGIITEYRINITELETGNVISLISFNTLITVQFLHPYYTYVCVVSAVTNAEGPSSEELVITTPQDGKKLKICAILITKAVFFPACNIEKLRELIGSHVRGEAAMVLYTCNSQCIHTMWVYSLYRHPNHFGNKTYLYLG